MLRSAKKPLMDHRNPVTVSQCLDSRLDGLCHEGCPVRRQLSHRSPRIHF